MMIAAAEKMLAAVQAIGFVGHLREAQGPAGRSVALRFVRESDCMGGVLVWWIDAEGAGKLELCTAVSTAGFKSLSSDSLLPYLEGEEAYRGYLARRAEINAKTAASREEMKALAAGPVGQRIAEMLALEEPPPVEWMTGGLVGETVKLRKLIAKGEANRNAGRGDARDRAGG